MSDLPVSRLTLFSSGVGFFEHQGSIAGTEEITLPFHIDAVNDALKSLVINDPAGSSTVFYPSEETQEGIVLNQSINLEGSSIQSMLQSLKGAEIEVFIPDSVKGRIIFTERRTLEAGNSNIHKDFLSISTRNGIKTICIDDISHFTFNDPKINEDLFRALDLALKSHDKKTRSLTIKLSGNKKRKVSLNYVIPAAVWKVSYRLNLSNDKPFLLGWAIVDNNSDNDWNNIILSLATGKPVSFTQDLYKVHNSSRPTIPLLTEGIANKKKLPLSDSSKDAENVKSVSLGQDELDKLLSGGSSGKVQEVDVEPESVPIETAGTHPAGDQFEFTMKKPVSLSRHQSAMLPLVKGEVKTQKSLVFSKEGKTAFSVYNPSICVELTNDTGMKLPAGPITVYDGKTYAGDALINFFPEDEKRLIYYGEELSVTGSFISNSTENISIIKIDNGILTQNKKTTYKTVYTFRNVGKEPRDLVIEHPVTSKTALVNTAAPVENLPNLYRFTETLPPTAEFVNFTVSEEKTVHEEIDIIKFNYQMLEKYLSGNDKRENILDVLKNAYNLNEKIKKAENAAEDLKKQRKKLIEKQERTRKNLEAAGNQSDHGKDYLHRLAKEDSEIDELEARIQNDVISIDSAKKEYEDYLSGLKIE